MGNNVIPFFFDKNKMKTYLVKEFKEQISPPFSAVSDSKGLVSIIEPLNINQLINPSILNKENKLKFEHIGATDNPIIIYYHY